MKMKKRKIIFLLLMVISLHICAQQNEKDSLLAIINQQKGDTTEVNALSYIGSQESESDSIKKYAALGLQLAERLNYTKGKADCFLVFSYANDLGNNIASAMQYCLNALDIYKELNDHIGTASAYLSLQAIYRGLGDYRNALNAEFTGNAIAEKYDVKGTIDFPGHHLSPLFLSEIAQTYVLMNQLDSALYYTQQSISKKELYNGAEFDFAIYLLATVQTMKGDFAPALENYRKAIPLAIQNGFPWDTLQIFSGMSTLFRKTGKFDSSIHYAESVVRSWNNQSEYKNLFEAMNNLAQVYKLKGNKDSALKYLELSQTIKDSIFTTDKNREIQNIVFNEKLKQQQIAAEQLKYKNRVQVYALAAGIFILLFIAGIFWRNSRQQQKAKNKIEKAYSELKNTQTQLIQSEKMASLGELTAGIAHEIQNPLNFVNNFSEVNAELIDELRAQLKSGNTSDALNISNDIMENEHKIIHHGKRADTVVKGMLQHARSSTGQKEPTDINELAREYLRLSYHGIRAKDKSFKATIETHFDESIGKINIVPRDIGRVLLNMFNNAFYAVSIPHTPERGVKYEPTVTVSTKLLALTPGGFRGAEIRISDNGSGIPQKILDKIFQPFFTTKPPGMGTGLGLSLSYDIIKAHGGEVKVDTKPGEFATFIIILPINQT